MLLAKFNRIVVFSLVWVLLLSLIPSAPVSSLEENALNTKVQQVEQEKASKAEVVNQLKNYLGEQTNSGIRMDKEFMYLERGFDAFPADAKIDLTLRDVDIASILKIIAKEGGMNLVLDESVMGFMTAELKNISLNEAMQTILTSEELEARISNNTIFIASRPVMAKKGLNRRFIKTFKLNNSDPVYVSSILRASIFNKGYKVNDSADGMALQAVSADSGDDAMGSSSTGQSTLVESKTIQGKIEKLQESENFGDAAKLASEIKIQHYTASTGDIQVENNDGGAIVIPDTRTRSILVAGLKRDIMLAEEAVKYLDKPLKQVSIEVSLIELKKDSSKDLGLNIAMQNGNTSGGFNALSGALSGMDFTSAASQTGMSFSSINNLTREIAFKINALIEDEEAKLLANPKIIALNGSESLIKITEQVVSTVETTITDTAVTYSAELSDVGIVLNILPKVGSNDYITMRIRPSITSALPQINIGEFSTGGGGSDAAIKVTPISTREVILQDVRVKSGETLAIAGLTKENKIVKEGKIPFLADIPLLGKLFRTTEVDNETNELVILIKPVIIDDIALNAL